MSLQKDQIILTPTNPLITYAKKEKGNQISINLFSFTEPHAYWNWWINLLDYISSPMFENQPCGVQPPFCTFKCFVTSKPEDAYPDPSAQSKHPHVVIRMTGVCLESRTVHIISEITITAFPQVTSGGKGWTLENDVSGILHHQHFNNAPLWGKTATTRQWFSADMEHRIEMIPSKTDNWSVWSLAVAVRPNCTKHWRIKTLKHVDTTKGKKTISWLVGGKAPSDETTEKIHSIQCPVFQLQGLKMKEDGQQFSKG